MNDSKQTMNQLLRAAKGDSLTAVATQRNRALNDEIRAKANIGVTVGGEKRQEGQGGDQEPQQPNGTGNAATTQQEPPKAPEGNAGNGATQVTQAPPDMNSVIRGAWLGKQRNIVNRYTQTGAEVK